MSFRSAPAGVVHGPLGEGTLNLPAAWQQVRGMSRSPIKFTVTSPYMLAQTLLDQHYGDVRALAAALAEVLRAQVAEIDAAVDPDRRGESHRPRRRMPAGRTSRSTRSSVACGGRRPCTCASATMAARASSRESGVP